MTALLKKIADDLMKLSPVERIELADTLYGSVEEPLDDDVDKAWKKEIAHRLDEYEAGRSTVLTAQQTRARIRKAIVEARRASAPSRR